MISKKLIIELLKQLISFNSVTPNDNGAIGFIANLLVKQGFKVYVKEFGQEYKVKNLYGYFGNGQPNICFAGHIDVVPAGFIEQWKYPPFCATQYKDKIYGRGVVDMKGAISAMLSAVFCFIDNNNDFNGTISFLITADEEGEALFGTKKMLEWIYKQGHKIDFTILGEPTCTDKIGDTIKIGRRGSINFDLKVFGKQGHVAYPHLAINPNHLIVKILNRLISYKIDEGNEFFAPSNLEVVSIDTNNNITNIIPEIAKSKFNIRFNDIHTNEWLLEIVKKTVEQFTANYDLQSSCRSKPFLAKMSPYILSFKKLVHEVTKIKPEFSTLGGTSDAYFFKDYSPVVEFGLLNTMAHKINEHCLINDLQTLCRVYYNALCLFLMSNSKFRTNL